MEFWEAYLTFAEFFKGKKTYCSPKKKHRVVLHGQVYMENINAAFPQSSIISPLLFLIYINEQKLLADDASLFSAVSDTQTSPNDLNKDLETANNWASQWKMNFKMENPNSSKQAQEVIFSRKAKEIYHHSLPFDNSSVSQSTS